MNQLNQIKSQLQSIQIGYQVALNQFNLDLEAKAEEMTEMIKQVKDCEKEVKKAQKEMLSAQEDALAAKKLAEQYDEITLLEILNIDSFDLVEAFFDRIEEKYEYFNKEFWKNRYYLI